MLKCEFHTSFTPLPAQTHGESPAIGSTQPLPRLFQPAQLTPHNPPLHKNQHHLSCTKDRKLLPARGTPWEVCRDNILPGASPQLLKMVPDLLLSPLPISPAQIPAPLSACLRNPLLTQLPAAPSTPHPAGAAAPPATLAL